MNNPEEGGFHLEQLKIEEAEVKRVKAKDKHKKELLTSLINRCFSAHFLVFIVVLIVIYSGLKYMDTESNIDKIIEYWKVILPVITTYIGFAIGRKTSDE